MMMKSKKVDAIYHSETLCSHTVLDKVLTGNKKAAIVKCMSSPNTLLAKIVFLHDRPDMLVSFNMSPLPLAFFCSLQKAAVACQLGQSTRLVQEEGLQRQVPLAAVI